MSQEQQIKKHLQSGKHLSPLGALSLYGCLRLSARIYGLKREGMRIKTKIITQGKKHFAQYSI